MKPTAALLLFIFTPYVTCAGLLPPKPGTDKAKGNLGHPATETQAGQPKAKTSNQNTEIVNSNKKSTNVKAKVAEISTSQSLVPEQTQNVNLKQIKDILSVGSQQKKTPTATQPATNMGALSPAGPINSFLGSILGPEMLQYMKMKRMLDEAGLDILPHNIADICKGIIPPGKGKETQAQIDNDRQKTGRAAFIHKIDISPMEGVALCHERLQEFTKCDKTPSMFTSVCQPNTAHSCAKGMVCSMYNKLGLPQCCAGSFQLAEQLDSW